ncbi:MAG: hypothetical protein H6741_27370 [Alphaproteobacteria bacterium]|nr:hypothetical protein [Alphaproteobacteria bacterium]
MATTPEERLRAYLDRATPDAAEQAEDLRRLRQRRPPQRPVLLWAGLGLAAAALLLAVWSRPAPERGRLVMTVADRPDAQPLVIHFTYPEDRP